MNLVKAVLLITALSAVGCVWERGPDRGERGARYYDDGGNLRYPEAGRGDEQYRGDPRDRNRDDYCMHDPDECRR